MRNVFYKMKKDFRRPLMLRMVLLSALSILTVAGLPTSPATAYAMAANVGQQAFSNCPVAADPTSRSLLVVLLDRSGSLIIEPGATDPNGYSTSVTKALADLWPGVMAVIPFSGDTTQLPIFGPDTLSDPTQRTDLKNKVQNYPIGGDTPLGPAMQEALDLLHQRGNPQGSRVIVITDGNPTGQGNNDGTHQEQHIRSSLIPLFCNQGIPVSAFGLTIDPNTQDGKDATHLLNNIATGTGSTYTNVTGPEDLAREVVSLYAQWLGLTFTPVKKSQDGNFPVSIDSFAQQVFIVTFRSDSNYQVTLIGPAGEPVTQGVQVSTPPDRHYEIDSLNVSGPIIPGTYTVNVNGDPNAQVYTLISSPLQVRLIAPAVRTVAYDNQPVRIQAEFLNGKNILTPQQGQAQIIARITLLANGRPVGPPTNDVVLTQQGAIFSGQTLIYNQPGQLQIELLGTYQQVQRQAGFSLQLLKPPAPPPKPIDLNRWLHDHSEQIIFGAVWLILLLIAAAIAVAIIHWRHNQPKPFGYLTNGRVHGDVELANFRRTVISSSALQAKGNFNFRLASFELVFPKDGNVYIRATDGNVSKVAIDVPGQLKPVEVTRQQIELKAGRKIYVDGNRVASFETSPGRRWA